MRLPRLLQFAIIAVGLASVCLTAADAQSRSGPAARQSTPAGHGDPPGWRFKLPAGADAARGRSAFEKFECHKCHEVKGQAFAAPTQRDAIGPELSSMAGHHSAGFLAESIVNPNALIDPGQGYTAPDGSSKMPSFNDSMTVQELIDLVAFLKSLSPPSAGSPAPGPRRHRH